MLGGRGLRVGLEIRALRHRRRRALLALGLLQVPRGRRGGVVRPQGPRRLLARPRALTVHLFFKGNAMEIDGNSMKIPWK